MPPSASDITPSPLPESGQSMLGRLWRPKLASEQAGLLWPYRVRMLCGLVVGFVLFIAVVLVFAWASGVAVPAFMLRLVGAIFILSLAVTRTVRLWLLLRLQQWMGLDGQLARRAERPRRFWALVGMHAVAAGGPLFGAIYLLWTALFD